MFYLEKKKKTVGFQIKTPCRKKWHISNQMPYIKYSKLYHGFKSVPRKKDTFKKPYFDSFLTHYLREQRRMAGVLGNVLIWNK